MNKMLNHAILDQLSKKLKIHKWGVTPAKALESQHLEEWLQRGYAGNMGYMSRNLEKRVDPGQLLPGAKSVISIFVNYHQERTQSELDGVISKYARGLDYHKVLKDQLHQLAGELHKDEVQGMSSKQVSKIYRIFVDSAPVMDKQWAVAAGLGWQGKHSNVITREFGSWGFLGEIITTLSFDQYDVPMMDFCGSCSACIAACPTQAIVEPYVVDGSKCISYATIELPAEESIPAALVGSMEDWVFGCDVCQDVCPWNRFAVATDIDAFSPVPGWEGNALPDFQNMTELEFKARFNQTPLERPGLAGLQRNQAIRD